MKKVLSVTVSVLFACVLSCPLLFVEDAAAFDGPLGGSCQEVYQGCLEGCNGIGDPLDVVMCQGACHEEHQTCSDADVENPWTINPDGEVCLANPISFDCYSELESCKSRCDSVYNMYPFTQQSHQDCLHTCSKRYLHCDTNTDSLEPSIDSESSSCELCLVANGANWFHSLPGNPDGFWYDGNYGGVCWYLPGGGSIGVGGAWIPTTQEVVICFRVSCPL